MKISEYVDLLYPIIVKYADANNIKYPRAIMAQALCESWIGSGISSLAKKYHNHFGMKAGGGYRGTAVNMKTKEEYTVGVLTTITDAFRSYANDELGVIGYFEFIKAPRYSNLWLATSDEDYIRKIKADGWATSSKYVDTVTKYLKYVPESEPQHDFSAEDLKLTGIAHEVIAGLWGVQPMREKRLTAAGYCYKKVQQRVNELLRRI